MKIKKCRSCEFKSLKSILDLGKQPWCNDFILKKNIENKEKTYPLHLVQCKNCELLQLDYTVKKEVMFSKHDYLSSTTRTLKNFFLNLAKENKRQFRLRKNDKILDIGGNDGTQMLQYKKIGFKNVINVESASNIAKISKKAGVKTFNNFFNLNFAKKNFKPKSINLINASGVFFHLEELHSVIEGINYCLVDDGVLIVQFMYAGAMIKNKNFDSIYHEHLCLYTIQSLSKLLSKHDLEIFDCKFEDIHSGSVISKICKKKSRTYPKTKRYFNTIKEDKKFTKTKFEIFGKNIKKHISKLKKKIISINKSGKKIYCYGAPAKGNTLLNTMKVTNKLISKCVEVNKLKIGKYLPGSKIPIVDEYKIKNKPDVYFLLSHNFGKEILKKNKDQAFLIPFPKIRIIKC
jgi:hypothetical protein